jgi:Ca-activated chloride channel family protein
MLCRLAIVVSLCFTPSAQACDLALLLAVDVSGSVDPHEYRVQMDGLAVALQDGQVADGLVAANAHVALMQWTGSGRQQIVVDWVAVPDQESVTLLAQQIAASPRIWRDYSTAIGEALILGSDAFARVPDCGRRVIDVSGDGPSNEGVKPPFVRPMLLEGRITVNALVIEGALPGLTDYFRREVIFGPGAFAVTANSFEDYPDKILIKLQREVTAPTAMLQD